MGLLILEKTYELTTVQTMLLVCPIIISVLCILICSMCIYSFNLHYVTIYRFKYLYFFIAPFLAALVAFFGVTEWNKLTTLIKCLDLLLPFVGFGVVNWITVRNTEAAK